jgi:hypothetical protein
MHEAQECFVPIWHVFEEISFQLCDFLVLSPGGPAIFFLCKDA